MGIFQENKTGTFCLLILESEYSSIMRNTKISYMYRDASNYKFHGEFVISGVVRMKDIVEFLFDGEFFVPHEIGLEHLLDLPMNQDDHYLHTFENFEDTIDINSICNSMEFIQRVEIANKRGWLSSID
ncbi:MAG: hypothetical protein AAF478_12615 [Pseudomonadota bacterium]